MEHTYTTKLFVGFPTLKFNWVSCIFFFFFFFLLKLKTLAPADTGRSETSVWPHIWVTRQIAGGGGKACLSSAQLCLAQKQTSCGRRYNKAAAEGIDPFPHPILKAIGLDGGSYPNHAPDCLPLPPSPGPTGACKLHPAWFAKQSSAATAHATPWPRASAAGHLAVCEAPRRHSDEQRRHSSYSPSPSQSHRS
jgi:hypothetical protein